MNSLYGLIAALISQLFFVNLPSYAQDILFHCTVLNVMKVDDAGLLGSIPKNQMAAVDVGDVFTVDRSNGNVLGRSVSTKFARNVSVIDKGGIGTSFKVSGVVVDSHPTIFFIDVQSYLQLRNPGLLIPFSGYFKYVHIAGVCK